MILDDKINLQQWFLFKKIITIFNTESTVVFNFGTFSNQDYMTGTHLKEFIQEKCKPVGQHLLSDRFCSVIGSTHLVSHNKIKLTEIITWIDYLVGQKDLTS